MFGSHCRCSGRGDVERVCSRRPATPRYSRSSPGGTRCYPSPLPRRRPRAHGIAAVSVHVGHDTISRALATRTRATRIDAVEPSPSRVDADRGGCCHGNDEVGFCTTLYLPIVNLFNLFNLFAIDGSYILCVVILMISSSLCLNPFPHRSID